MTQGTFFCIATFIVALKIIFAVSLRSSPGPMPIHVKGIFESWSYDVNSYVIMSGLA